MTGCSTPGTTTDDNGVNGKPTIIEKLTMRLQEPVSNFDPAVNVGNATTQIRILTEGLLYRQDETGEPQPELVDSVETSADELTQTMTLKSGLKYSDGTPLVANDVVAMFQRSVVDRVGGSALLTPFVESVEAPDDVTVVWHLLRPYAQLPLALALGDIGLHPANAMKDQDYFLNPVSAGPYVIDNFSAGDQVMRLVENPNYVGGALMVKAIDSVTVTDITQAALQLTSGQLDFAWGLPYSSVDAAKAISGIQVVLHPTGGVFQLGVNPTNGGSLADASVRQAMSLALDRAEISEKAWLGVAEPNPGWVFASAPGFSAALPNDGEQDIAAAKTLMESTPFASGFDITIDTFGVRDGHTATVTLIKEQLAEIGINVIVNPLEIPTALVRLNNNTFEGFFQGSVAPSAASVMVVDNCPSGVWGRWMPTGNPEICDLALQAMGEADPTANLPPVRVEPDARRRIRRALAETAGGSRCWARCASSVRSPQPSTLGSASSWPMPMSSPSSP